MTVDSKSIILGIDLGTTYSCVAYVDESDRPVVIPNAEGDLTTPSVVWFESEDNSVVGRVAKNSAVLYKDLIADCVKRNMGDATYVRSFWDLEYKPEMVSSMILRKIVKDAEQHLGLETGSLKNVVITCPAYFGINERAATEAAGELADLNVIRVMNEPTAAAFCYGLTRQQGDQNVLVYDLGGGTFDISLISVKENAVRTLITDGVRTLGGRDWDNIIVTYLADQFVEEHGEANGHPLDDPETQQQMQNDAEEAKKALTNRDKVPVGVSHMGDRSRIELTRPKFDELTEQLLLQTIETTRRALNRAREEKGVETVDKLLLVGGSTRMPQVAAKLLAEFGLEGEMFEPDLAVAKGAAIIGDLINKGIIPLHDEDIEEDEATGKKKFLPQGEETDKTKQRTITDVASKSFGVKILDQSRNYVVDHLVHNQDDLPLERVETYGTVDANQTAVQIEVYEQAGEVESNVVEKNIKITEGPLKLPPGLPQGEPIEVTFRLSADGRLKVTGRHKAETLELEAKVEGVMSKDEISEAKPHLQKIDVS